MKAHSITTPFATLIALVLLDGPSQAQEYGAATMSQNEHVRAALIADVDAIVPGQPFHIGVRLSIDENWHVNWINPGDAGLAPDLEWSLPDGFVADLMEWPHPWRYRAGPLVIFGYDREVLLHTRVSAPHDLETGSVVRIVANISWLACQEVCIPGGAKLSLDLSVAAVAAPAADRNAFEKAQALHPAPPSAWRFEGWYQDDYTIILELQSASGREQTLEEVFFFPYEQGIIENADPQKLKRTVFSRKRKGGYRLEIVRSRTVRATPARLKGVIVSRTGWAAGGATPALAVDIPLYPSPR